MVKGKALKEVEKTEKFSLSVLVIYILLILFCLIVISPLLIVLSSSLREPGNMQSPLNLFVQFSLKSYRTAYAKMNYPMQLLNSIMTTGGSVVVIVLISSMAAYPVARIKKGLSKGLYYFFIAGLVIPAQMVIVPIAQIFGGLNIPNTRFTPMIMFITCSLPFSTFLFTGFLKGVPAEVEESAFLDGANLWQRYRQIVFPLLKPATVSVIITQSLWIWNDYFFPMVFISKSSQYSLPVGMIQFLGDRENPAQWNVLFAACVLCALPLIVMFTFLQKQFINGIAAGAVKG
ncbi:raffinose/stachyose/melibiose transport system permease protein [Anaerocolumna jejuensis DSM 15929]|uniref:Raffinose/stachyose/melibiose transport system permease protein n=1 Tax=Anaerocolumna jejuensis DSM 15929 TaxID=1121322 RepID=A0A1M6X209_9FIRM|nr:carbohydrate ABC transporter permease [Anaerocolumna jejuensis]SHK99931.1 raffinose/stachyose/melibiose transport system permease protein [Anaerocolumna jejuensis DSM 15929]